ncbi:MAG: LysM peptidoglycan-binding domain-containing protein [Phototrophicaceae bacterium]
MRRFIVILGLLVSMLSMTVLTTTAQESDSPIIHVVQAGENLYRISLRYNVPLTTLAQANGISNTNLIFVGQQLTIPGTTGGTPPVVTNPPPTTPTTPNPPPTGDATTYTVQAGDSLSRIASRFGTTFTAIAAANGIANPNLIFVGQVLSINGGTVPTNPPTTGNPNPPPNTAPITGFAVGGHVTQGNYPFSDAMRQTGMTWAKRQIRWDGSASAANFQGEIDAAKSRGFRVLLSVVGDRNQLAANPTQYYQNFAQFLGGLAAGGADAIEVWNEPNIDREWASGQISGANYTQMLSAAYQIIKANNPSTLVISGAPAPSGGLPNNATVGFNDDAFLSSMRAAGAANFMDCVGIHYNAGTVPPSATSGAPVGSSGHYSWYYPSMVNLYRNQFPGLPLCFTEIGYVTAEGFPQGLPPNFSWASGNSVQEQADWLAQAAVLARNSGVVRLFIIWNVDSTTYTDDPQAGYAIVRPDGNCPACNTVGTALNG